MLSMSIKCAVVSIANYPLLGADLCVLTLFLHTVLHTVTAGPRATLAANAFKQRQAQHKAALREASEARKRKREEAEAAGLAPRKHCGAARQRKASDGDTLQYTDDSGVVVPQGFGFGFFMRQAQEAAAAAAAAAAATAGTGATAGAADDSDAAAKTTTAADAVVGGTVKLEEQPDATAAAAAAAASAAAAGACGNSSGYSSDAAVPADEEADAVAVAAVAAVVGSGDTPLKPPPLHIPSAESASKLLDQIHNALHDSGRPPSYADMQSIQAALEQSSSSGGPLAASCASIQNLLSLWGDDTFDCGSNSTGSGAGSADAKQDLNSLVF
jgi:hypothetical protein